VGLRTLTSFAVLMTAGAACSPRSMAAGNATSGAGGGFIAGVGGAFGGGGSGPGALAGIGGAAGMAGLRGTGGMLATGGNGAMMMAAGAGGMPATAGNGGTAGSSGAGGSAGMGMAGSGGMAGSSAGGTGGGMSCPFPTSFQWTSSGPLADPKSPSGHTFVSLKDFTVVKWNGQFVVYATVFDTSASWSAVNFNFADFSQAGAAPQTYMGTTPAGGTVAPTLFYFTPKQLWVLTYQWGFKYSTGSDPTQPSTWSTGKSLLNGDPTGGGGTGPIDQTVICDASNCYLFFAGDNGHIYRASMPIANFPGTFSNAASILSDSTANLFEAVQVYTVKGTGKYLMIVEAEGAGGRYFRAFSAPSLDGTFSAIAGASSEATPFAGKNNVSFSGAAWTNDISHGDMVREDPSETQTIDPCNMQFLYQGRDPKSSAAYSNLPYRPGLLTKKN
jgi:hypothetical protein